MKRSAAEIIREYGPFPGVERVNGVTYDGRHVWFASGNRSKHRPRACDDSCARWRRFGAGVGRRHAVDGAISVPKDPPARSRNRRDPSHHRVQSLRHRSELDRRRTLARHFGRRRKRLAARRSAHGRSAGDARYAAGSERVGGRSPMAPIGFSAAEKEAAP
jgi:hypothetical protein